MSAAKSLLRRGAVIALSISALSGCVSAVSDDMRATNSASPAAVQAAGTDADERDTGYRDPMVTVADAGEKAGATAAGETAAEANAAQSGETDLAAAVMQPSSVDAGRTSIFANTAVTGTARDQDTAGARANPALASIYKGNANATAPEGRLPLEDMPVPQADTANDEESSALPDRVPLPKSGRMALVAEPSGNAAELALVQTPEAAGQAASSRTTDGTATRMAAGTKPEKRKPMTLASLFSSKRKAADGFDGDRFTEKPKRKVINRESVMEARRASLAVNVLPGVDTDPSTAAQEEDHEGDDAAEAKNGFVEIASLAGLARLAPNGLLLQTARVKTGCFKPELVRVLKSVEKHYGRPIIVTSGLRKAKHNRKRQSLHTRCEAADIQIAGVNKWELAEYLRSMPGRGGVGTYCHTESVHIDIGSERDWNWRCRRKKKK